MKDQVGGARGVAGRGSMKFDTQSRDAAHDRIGAARLTGDGDGIAAPPAWRSLSDHMLRNPVDNGMRFREPFFDARTADAVPVSVR